ALPRATCAVRGCMGTAHGGYGLRLGKRRPGSSLRALRSSNSWALSLRSGNYFAEGVVVRGTDVAATHLSTFIRQLTSGMAAETLADQSDQQLVAQLLAGRAEAVFEALVRRHGPMVYRVCWRVLQQEQDAEDAFQAAFLVLAQKLHTVRKHTSLASWL